MKWEDMEAKPVCNMRRSLTRIVANGGQRIVAFYLGSKKAEACKLERNKADQTRNGNKAEHFQHWTAWSQKTIAELKAQKDKTADGGGKCDRRE